MARRSKDAMPGAAPAPGTGPVPKAVPAPGTEPVPGTDPALSKQDRATIQASGVLQALIAYVEGGQKMDPSQVTAALGLLKKVLPDISSVASPDQAGGEPPTILFQNIYESRED